jgi:hypothetical protein
MAEIWQAREAPLLLIVCRYLMQLSASIIIDHYSSYYALTCIACHY